jgi:sulfur relay protein TusC/DsrF
MSEGHRQEIHVRQPQGALRHHLRAGVLEVVLIAATFDQDVSLVFMDDGVYQLKKGQDTKGIGIKNFSPTYRALDGYDIEKLYVERESMEARGLTEADLLVTSRCSAAPRWPPDGRTGRGPELLRGRPHAAHRQQVPHADQRARRVACAWRKPGSACCSSKTASTPPRQARCRGRSAAWPTRWALKVYVLQPDAKRVAWPSG